MNESVFPSIHPSSPPPHPGVYADLAELVRLKFRTRGFSLLPRQPVHSILAGRHASRLRGRGLNFEEIRRYLPGDDIRDQVLRILETVVKKNHAMRVDPERQANPAMLNRVLERGTRVALHDHLVCLIGDGAGADAESVRHITLLSAHNDVLAAFIYDPLEATLPDAGRLVMVEGELQLEVNTADRGLRERYQTEFEQRLVRMQELSRQRQIPVLPLSTAEPVPEQVRRLLGDRPRARREG